MANLYSLSTSMNKSSVSLKTSKTAFLGQWICVHLCLCPTRRYLKLIKKKHDRISDSVYIQTGMSIHKEVKWDKHT